MSGHYDADTDRISLGPRATLYTMAHERAHSLQKAHRTWAWRMHERFSGTRCLANLTRVLVELEAAKMARSALLALGLWRPLHRREMLAGLASYLKPW